jgi:hypothetical protein
MYQIYNDVLNNDEAKFCYELLRNGSKWSFAGDSFGEGFTFWYYDLNDNEFFNKTFLNKIENLTNKKFKLERVYANGQTFGLSGNLHIDDDVENTYTFLYYVNPVWDIQWGGATVFYKNDNEYTTFIPKPNAGLLFESNILHAGLEPTRHYRDLRITVAFKLIHIKG